MRPNASYDHAVPLPPDVDTSRFAESYVEVVSVPMLYTRRLFAMLRTLDVDMEVHEP